MKIGGRPGGLEKVTRILVHVEGQTEEEFVNSILAPHLYTRGFTVVSARLIGRSRARKKRGGTCPWESVHTEIARHLSSDTNAFGTTLVDYYALPAGVPTAGLGEMDATASASPTKPRTSRPR